MRGNREAAVRSARGQRTRPAVATLDAEDIALARLQAQLRKSEAVRPPATSRKPLRGRMTVSLPTEMLRRLRESARREGRRVSQIVEAAVARHLKLR